MQNHGGSLLLWQSYYNTEHAKSACLFFINVKRKTLKKYEVYVQCTRRYQLLVSINALNWIEWQSCVFSFVVINEHACGPGNCISLLIIESVAESCWPLQPLYSSPCCSEQQTYHWEFNEGFPLPLLFNMINFFMPLRSCLDKNLNLQFIAQSLIMASACHVKRLCISYFNNSK